MIDRRLFLAGATSVALTPIHASDKPALSVFELRQYTLKGGKRAAFTELFAQQFVRSQDDVGSHVLGVSRDLDDPDRFVWMRGFEDMAARKRALEAFYLGPVWQAHRNTANAMIVDSDNVLLLMGAMSPAVLSASGVTRIAIHRLREVDPAVFATFFRTHLAPCVAAAGGRMTATLTTAAVENNFPRLPVREGDPVFLWITHFRDEAAERAFTSRLVAKGGWRDGVDEAVLPALMQKPEVLRLAPSIPILAAGYR